MQIRTLFLIILKIIGLLLVKVLLETAPQLVAVIGTLTAGAELSDVLYGSSTMILMLLCYGAAAWFFIFRSEYLLKNFDLEKGFEQKEIAPNMHRSDVLAIAVIVLGGWMVANEIPHFFKLVYNYFLEKRMTMGMTRPDTGYLIFSIAEIIIGLLLIGQSRVIVNFIERKRRNMPAAENQAAE